MTRIKAEILSSLKTLNITYPIPYENLQGTPTALPTTEPVTSQIVYTVVDADVPSISLTVESKKIVVFLGAGNNTDAVAQTVYWRMIKNGSSVANGSASVSAGNYYTVNAFFYDVAVGDTLELRLWASSTGVNWDYTGRFIQLSRVAFFEKYPLAVFRMTIAANPTLSLGSPTVVDTGYLKVWHKQDTYYPLLLSAAATYVLDWFQQNSTYKMFQFWYGDHIYANTAVVQTSSTSRPRYYRNLVPSQIILRALKV
jgi:hypothetical protein